MDLHPALRAAGRGVRRRHRVLGLAGPARRRGRRHDRRGARRARRRRLHPGRRAARAGATRHDARLAADAAAGPGDPRRGGRRRSPCTSRTASRSRCGSSWRRGGVRSRPATSWTTGRRPAQLDGRLVGEATFEIPGDLPLGYHTLRARSARRRRRPTALIVTPAWLGLPERLGDRRVWGFATQLYSVRSARSWGVGDLADLADLARLGRRRARRRLRAGQPAARRRAGRADGAVAVPADHPPVLQPALPAGRAHPRVRRAAGGRPGRTVDRLAHERARPSSTTLDRIDRDTAWTAKRAALQLVHAVPRSRRAASSPTAAYREREGDGARRLRHLVRARRGARRRLARLAGGAAGRRRRRPWPAFRAANQPTRSTSTAGCSGCSTSSSPPPRPRRCGPGWRSASCTTSRSACTRAARTPGRCRTSTPQGITVGAPPDPFNQIGQDWSQPPWRPDRLAELGYAPFRDLVAAVLRHAGGVRVDHVIGLFRLWWIPEGTAPTAGHLRPLRPRGADRHPGAGGAAGRRASWSARTSAPSSRGCATTCASAASSAPRSCGSSRVDGSGAPAAGRAVAGVLPGVGDHPRPAADRRATSPATTSGCATSSGC